MEQTRHWHSITTAPTDGTVILGYNSRDGEMAVIRWRKTQWEVWLDSQYLAASWEPSHWQPLPDPPSPT